ncbi:MAG: ATP-binding protein [Chloroflexota bacterium]
MQNDPYKRLAERLDALPNGFPPAPDGSELRLLAKIFTPQEAALAAELRLGLETPAQLVERLAGEGKHFGEPRAVQAMLKTMARNGLIHAGRCPGGLGYGLLPFVVGIYEYQIGRIDAEMARLFEDYYRTAFRHMLALPDPAIHRVIPVGESVPVDLEIRPFESARQIVDQAQSWGVLDCICRTQQALIGKGCAHPVDVCMTLSATPNAFDHSPVVRPLTHAQALETLDRAARAGLVHSVSNVRDELTYICNCCTCACGILRGVSELGLANVVAHSAFVNRVDPALCIGCEECLPACQFKALALQEYVMQVDENRCTGCGVCVPTCAQGALSLARRPEAEVQPVPASEHDWRMQRARARGIDMGRVL